VTSDTQAASQGPKRRRLLAGLFGAALLVACVWYADPTAVWAQLRGVSTAWVVAYAGIYAFQLPLLGLRWAVVARLCGHRLSALEATLEYALSIALNQVLPSGVAGDGMRALRARHEDASLGPVLNGLIVDRLSGQLGLGVIVLGTSPLGPVALWSPLGLASASAGLLLVAVTGRALLPKLSRRLSQGVAGPLKTGAEALMKPRNLLRHLPLSCLLTLLFVAQFQICATALGIPLSPREACWLAPLVLVAASFPSLIGGLGAREGASGLLFLALGRPASDGIALSVTFGLFSLLSSLPGLLLLLRRQRLVQRPEVKVE